MKIPDLRGCKTCKEFLRLFVEMNKQENPIRSQRFFAQKLRWPIPYINQVISGKKNFTIRRCVEFIEKIGLDEFDADRLLFMTIQESNDPMVSSFAKKRLKMGRDAYYDHNENTLDCSPHDGLYTIFAFELSRYCGRIIAFEDLIEMNPQLKFLDSKRYADGIARLEKERFITKKGKNHSFKEGKINFTSIDGRASDDWRAFFQTSTQIYASRLLLPGVTQAHSHGLARIPSSRIQDVKDKIFEMRKWITSLENMGDNVSSESNLILFVLGVVTIVER